MSRSIRLSPKHGVNPTIPICFWCGKQKNEIALLGRMNRADDEAPMTGMVLDYEPCDKCKEQFKKCVVCVEVTQYPNQDGQPPMCESRYPTGRYVGITPEAATRVFGEALNTEFDIGQMIHVEREVFDKVFGDALK